MAEKQAATGARGGLVSFQILSNGSVIPGTYEIISIQVHREINQIPTCEIQVLDGSSSRETFPISEGSAFVPGAEIEVKVGYDSRNATVFKGIVIKQEISAKASGGPFLAVHCADEAIKMTVGRRNASFTEKKDSDIITEVIQNNGLSSDVTDTEQLLQKVVQYYATDWDFLVTRADVNGMVVLVEDGKIRVKRPQELDRKYIELTYGDNVLRFDSQLDATSQFKSVKSYAWSPGDQENLSGSDAPKNAPVSNLTMGTLSQVLGLDHYDLQTAAGLSSEELASWAKAQGTKSTYAKVRGSFTFQGNARAMPGTIMSLDGFGKRFNGNAFVSAITHELKDGDWRTTAKVGLSEKWYADQVKMQAPIASGLLPGVQGLQIGKVKQISQDPAGQYRVLVQLPLVQSNGEGVWARLANFYASANAGAFFYPEIDDEVVVGFFNDDPRYPVILGSMYSSGRVPSMAPNEGNEVKGIITREQLKVTFDENKKEITIQTPGNNKLVLSDEDGGITLADQNGNSIKMDADGVSIKSSQDLKLEASDGDIKLDALNISCTADVQFSANASASASLTAVGEVTINGAMVMIN